MNLDWFNSKTSFSIDPAGSRVYSLIPQFLKTDGCSRIFESTTVMVSARTWTSSSYGFSEAGETFVTVAVCEAITATVGLPEEGEPGPCSHDVSRRRFITITCCPLIHPCLSVSWRTITVYWPCDCDPNAVAAISLPHSSSTHRNVADQLFTALLQSNELCAASLL